MTEKKFSKSEQTKKFIIEQTAPMFNVKGYAGTSISDITSSTGLSKGSVYGNFSNKDELALAAFQYNIDKLYAPLIGKIAGQTNAIDKLMEYPKYFRANYKMLLDYGGCALLNTAVEADDTHPALRKLVNKSIRSWEKRIAGIIEDGKNNKDINQAADGGKFAILFMTLFEGSVMLSKSTGDKNYILTALDHMEELIKYELKPIHRKNTDRY